VADETYGGQSPCETFRSAGSFSGQSINRAPKPDRTKSALAHNRRARLFKTLRLWQKEYNELRVQAVLHDGSVALEFMTDDTIEAEEMRVQFLDFYRAAEVKVLDEPGWVAV
jgi:hypothetical protein